MATYLKTQIYSEDLAVIRSQTVIKNHNGLKMSYGWFVQEPDGSVIYFHPGGTDGQSSMITFNPVAQKGIAILTNSNNSDQLKKLFSEIVKYMY